MNTQQTMKTNILIAAAILILTLSASAQKGLYIGYENGIKFDFYDYIDNNANTYNHLAMDGVWGGYVGYKWKGYSVETGFYGYYLSSPFLYYDSLTGVPRVQGSSGSSGMDKWVIPVRFGKEFTFCSGRLFVKPEIGFLTMIARDPSADPWVGSSGYGMKHWWIDNEPPRRDSSWSRHYITGKYNFALESSLSGGVRLWKHFDIYLKGSLTTGFTNTMFSTITYDSPYQHLTAVTTTRNSMIYQIGVRYNF